MVLELEQVPNAVDVSLAIAVEAACAIRTPFMKRVGCGKTAAHRLFRCKAAGLQLSAVNLTTLQGGRDT